MEKRNILKLMALIVLMTVVFCGAAFAAETEWVACQNPNVHPTYTEGEDGAENGNAYGEHLTKLDVAATCSSNAKEAYHCLRCEAKGIANAYFLVEVEDTINPDKHNLKEFNPSWASAWGLEMTANCKHGTVTAKYCLDCQSAEKPEGVTLVEGNKTGWHKAPSEQSKPYCYIEVTVGTDVQPHANGTYNETQGIYTASTDEKTGNYLKPTCGTNGWTEHKCATCGKAYNVVEFVTADAHNWKIYVQKKNADGTKEEAFTEYWGDTVTYNNPATVDKPAESECAIYKETPVSCQNAYTRTQECATCGHTTTTTTGVKLDHNYVEDSQIVLDATCISAGYKLVGEFCSMCGEQNPDEPAYNEPIAKKNHDDVLKELVGWEDEVKYDKTGTVKIFDEAEGEGLKADTERPVVYFKGTDKEIAGKLVYTFVAPVCSTTDGSATLTCTLCDYNKSVPVEKGEHNWVETMGGSQQPSGEFDCTANGVRYYECDRYGCKETMQIANVAGEHDLHTYYELWNGSEWEPICYDDSPCNNGGDDHWMMWDEEGLKAVPNCIAYREVTSCWNHSCGNDTEDHNPDYCMNCNYYTVVKKAAKNPAKHVWKTEPTTTKASTCTVAGYKVFECEYCTATTTKPIELLAHDWKSEVTTMATCTTKGVLTKTCKVCNTVVTEDIQALGHASYVEEEVKPTCTKDGYYKKTCGICKVVVKETVYKAAHVMPTTTDGKLDESKISMNQYPTCTKDGAATFECAVCGVKVANGTVPALNHKFTEIVGIEGNDTTKAGKSAYVADDSKNKEPNCTDYGKTAEVCALCGHVKYTEDKEQLPKGHVKPENKFSYLTQATCTEKGKIAYNCEVCDTYLEEEVEAIGHQLFTYYDKASNSMITECGKCDYKDAVAQAKPAYEVKVSGNKGTVALKDTNVPGKLDRAWIRVSIGYDMGNGSTYAVVYCVEIDLSGDRETGTFKLMNVQGAGKCTGVSYMVVDNADADALTFSQALPTSYGMTTAK